MDVKQIEIIPEHLQKNRRWKAMLYLFLSHDKLNTFFNTKYFDLKNETVKFTALKKVAGPWSESEKFMLNLAAHVFNESHKVDLALMDYLDYENTKLAIEAIEIRYGY